LNDSQAFLQSSFNFLNFNRMLSLARVLILLGIVLIVVGGLVYIVARTGLPLGRLPGDISIERDNVSCFFPLATSILLSIILTIALNIIVRLLNK
jgi:hypothetical protein